MILAVSLPDNLLEASVSIISFVLGTKNYRQENINKFVHSVSQVGGERFYEILYKAQLLGHLNQQDLEFLSLDYKIEQKFSLYNGYIKALQKIQISELKEVIGTAVGNGLEPIILKGPGLWFSHYPNPSIRRVRDFDLQFRGRDELNIFCKLLCELGFENEEEELSSLYYELGEYRRLFNSNLSHVEKTYIENYDDTLHYCDFLIKGNSVISKTIVEPHVAPFVFRDGSYPLFLDNYFVFHPYFKGAKTYADFVLLPYLSIKIMQDFQNLFEGQTVKLKSLKLVADVIKVLSELSQVDVDKSISVASLWNCKRHLTLVMQMVSGLMPEVEFKGVSNNTDTLANVCAYL